MLTTRMVMMMVVVIHTVVLVQFLFPKDRVREREPLFALGSSFFLLFTSKTSYYYVTTNVKAAGP